MSRLRLLLAVAFTLTAAPAVPTAQPHQPNILFLAVDDFTRPYMRLIFESFTDAIAKTPNPPALYFESLEASRFGQQNYFAGLRAWFARKYERTPMDVIVAIGEDAVAFLADAHGEPWPSAQVLYLEATSMRVEVQTRLPRTGGLLLEDTFPPAIAVLKTVLPDTQYVALVYGASAVERNRYTIFVDKAKTAGVEAIPLVGMTIEDTRAAVAKLPPHTVVIVLAPEVDSSGRVLSAPQVCEAIASDQKAPVLTLEANNLGCGAIGGLMRDWTIIGRRLGEEALARLQTPSTAVVQMRTADFTTLAFDDRQLARWKIPDSRLPAGAAVRFREPNLWRDRRGLVLTTLGVAIVQALLIAGLVFEHRRRRRAEIESRRNLAAMAHLDRRAAMGELATSLAHELNQPLNAILQNAGVAQMLLASSTFPPELGELGDILNDIRKDDVRASEVIRRMRSLLRKQELELHPVDLNDVAAETIAIVRPDARAREIELDVDLADGVRPIPGDRVHLQQVLLNLLMNAMDAIGSQPPDRRRVRVSTAQHDGEVRLSVSDTGSGIPEDQLSKIFEPFYTTKSEGSGMGMGLAIARGIIEAHNGELGALNNPGGGATVWFSVPATPLTKVL